VVVVIIVVLSLAVCGALVVFVIGRVVRHWSRTREQASIVFAVQMALFAMVQAALERNDATRYNGQWVGSGRPVDPQWNSASRKARATVVNSAGLLRDAELRSLTDQLLLRTEQLVTATDAGQAEQLRHDVEALHACYRARSVEVVRTLGLKHLR
jgi:hypothetical protein